MSSYPERYMETLNYICKRYNYLSMNIDKEMETLRSCRVDKNDRIITFANAYFAYFGYCYPKLKTPFLLEIKNNIREVAKIMCPLDCIISKYKDNSVYVQKIKNFRPSQVYLLPTLDTDYNFFAYISEKNLKYVNIPERERYILTQEIESVPFTKEQFMAFIHWSARRNAMLVAYKYNNGTFFHTLKWIALFL